MENQYNKQNDEDINKAILLADGQIDSGMINHIYTEQDESQTVASSIKIEGQEKSPESVQEDSYNEVQSEPVTMECLKDGALKIAENHIQSNSEINNQIGQLIKNSDTKKQKIQQFFESSKIYPSLQPHSEMSINDDDLSQFYQFQKHYLIMSEAGKPIYSRYGDEEILSPFFATMTAILSKVQSYFVKVAEKEQKNQLRWISSGEFDCAILKKGNLIYMLLINNRKCLKEFPKQFSGGFKDDAYQQKMLDFSKSFQLGRSRRLKESATFIRLQLEYLHLQFISLVTSTVNTQLTKKPNLDIKTTITGLERTIDMMCEISNKSPSVFLQSFQPLRIPDSIRKTIEKCIEQHMPKTFACGMLVSALNPISIFTDPEQVSEIKPQDIQVLMNYIYANPSMKNGGETWTPICLPGINEQFLLHTYLRYFTINFGILIVCTDPNSFYECKERAEELFQAIQDSGQEGKSSSIIDLVDRCTIQMYTRFNMKELQLVIIKNNLLNQYTTYNFPLLTQVTPWHQKAIKIFERMNYRFEQHLCRTNTKQRLQQDFIIKEIYQDMTYAFVNHISQNIESKMTNVKDGKESIKRDHSLMICYDHRINNDFSQIVKYLLDDIKSEGKNCFITRLV